MKISIIDDWRVNEDKSGYLNRVDRVFEGTFIDVIEQRLLHHTTHGIFNDNIRTNDNFISSDIIVIDFDKGTISPEDVSKNVSLYSHAITASTNHMKDKGDGNGIIPRFHLSVELSNSVFGVDNYKKLIDYCIDKLNFRQHADKASSCAPRYWKRQKDLLLGEEKRSLNINQILDFINKTEENKNSIQKRTYTKIEWNITNFENTLKKIKNGKYENLLDNMSKIGYGHTSLCILCALMKLMGYEKHHLEEVCFRYLHTYDDHAKKTINTLWEKPLKSTY